MSAASPFNKRELRCIWINLQRLLPLGGRPPTPEELVEIGGVIEKTAAMISSDATLSERGEKVLEWRLHADDAPTQNKIRSFSWGSPFAITSKERRLDALLAEVIGSTPRALVRGDRTRRWVRVTRFTSAKTDDSTAVDAIGGKMPLDALVRAKVLNDDSEAFCRREGRVMRTKPGNAHVLVEVFEMSEEEVFDPGPIDGVCPPKKKRGGKFVAAVVADGALVPSDVEATTLLGTPRRRRR